MTALVLLNTPWQRVYECVCVYRPDFVCVWGPLTVLDCTVKERGWSLGSSAYERELVYGGLEGGCGDSTPHCFARLGWEGWPALAAVMTGTMVWKSSARALFQSQNPHVCLLRPHSEPRVPGLQWSPSCPGTRRRIKVAQPTSVVVVWCLLYLGWLIRDIHSSIALPCLPTWAQCRHGCVCVRGVRVENNLFVLSEDIWEACRCVHWGRVTKTSDFVLKRMCSARGKDVAIIICNECPLSHHDAPKIRIF